MDEMLSDLSNIVKEGWVCKKSRHVKQWRKYESFY